MTLLKRASVAALFLSCMITVTHAEQEIISIENAPSHRRPGDALMLTITDPSVTSITYKGRSYPLFHHHNRRHALIPIPGRENAGTHTLHVMTRSGTSSIPVTVHNRKITVIELPIPKTVKETPSTLITTLAKQNTTISETPPSPSPNTLFTKTFGLPLADNRNISSRYGEIRKTGNQSIRHLGVDFAARRGTPVYAMNAGRVLKAYIDPIYGNTVIIDHGAGITSLYMHLDTIEVKPSSPVYRGERIGTVGNTGLSSAPHLHLSLKVHGESVDPLSFISLF